MSAPDEPERDDPRGAGAPPDAEVQPEGDATVQELREHLAATVTETERLQAQLADAQARLRAVSKAYAEQKDEMAEFRRRTEQQGASRVLRQAAELVERFFEPVQNLRRALAAPSGDVATFKRGLDMVLHQFVEELERLGLHEVPGEGAVFDAEIHEAIAVQPVTDPAQDGRVLVVHSTGYRLDGRTLQPAMVVVGKYEEQRAGRSGDDAPPAEEPAEG